MRITELDGEKRTCEFTGMIEIKIEGKPDKWTSVATIQEAIEHFCNEKMSPLTRSTEIVVQSHV